MTITVRKSKHSFMLTVIASAIISATAHASPVTGPLSLANAPLFTTTASKPNILVVLDNSNSMDEDATGAAVGGASLFSKSEIARGVIRDQLIPSYLGDINLGLMAYEQQGVTTRHLHNSAYDASFNPSNYDPDYEGDRDSSTKRFRFENPTSVGNYVHFNINLPFYAGGNYGNAFCYSSTANFDDGTTNQDRYTCYRTKTGASDTHPGGFSSRWGNVDAWRFTPTDSDFAQGITDFGAFMTWSWVSPSWFANASPGGGYVHVPVAGLDSAQKTKLDNKMAITQFATNGPTNPALSLQNAGLTPIEGTLLDAKNHLQGNSLPESCGKDYVVFLTDGLPTTRAIGTNYADPAQAMQGAVNAATTVHDAGIETYMIGFSLPYGTDPTSLDQVAAAGGTTSAYSATDSASLSAAFSTIFGDIISKLGAAASASTNSTNLRTDTHVYLALFHSGDWVGHLLSKSLDEDGLFGAAEWDANTKLTAKDPATRKIITYSRDTGDGIPFTWSSINGLTDSTQKDFLNNDAFGASDGDGENRVSYLRGNNISGMRPRIDALGVSIDKLGDIVHSTPFYSGKPNAGYAGSSYYTFARAHKDREAVIYVGANDGMLHGFAADDGEELLAYVPGKLYSKLSQLTHVNYGTNITPAVPHQYFVDGSPMVADAQLTISGTQTWKTVLVGGFNSGGQGYYALDITNPSAANFTESNAADLVLWEFTDEDDPEMGYSYTQPSLNWLTGQSSQIAKMANGRWAVIVGNGYNSTEADGHASTSGNAYLFIIYLEKGLDGSWSTAGDYEKINTGAGTVTVPNGLSTPQPIDDDGDGDVDYVYAGDLYGNVWRFNVSDSSPSNWTKHKIARTKDDANNLQPITTAPVVTRGQVDGTYIVGIGTGKYIEHDDVTDHSVQSFYGFIDRDLTNAPSKVIRRNTLTEQEVVVVVTNSGKQYRVLTNADASTDGWYIDLPTTGERVAYNPITRDGRFVFVTLIPDTDPCEAGGTSWLMEVNPFNGGQLGESPFDVDGDRKFNAGDKVEYTDDGETKNSYVSGIKSTIGINTTPAVINKTRSSEFKVVTGSIGQTETVLESKAVLTGRMSWQEIR
ncbi:MAG: PilC/PilY family type IV pilus protein [Methylococcales bacterium]